MDILKFKIPLVVDFPEPVIKNSYETYSVNMEDIDFNSIVPFDIDKLDGQYDWVDAWMDRDYDKEMAGFNNKDVLMEVVYDKGNYMVTLVSDKPFSTIVTNHRWYSRDPKDIRKITLKEAVIDFMEGCISDGIGENEIGHIMYQHKVCEVWLGNLIEM